MTIRTEDSPSPSPSATPDPSEITENVIEDVTSGDWWLSDFLPAAIKILVIVLSGLAVRHFVIKSINSTVARMAASREEKLMDEGQATSAEYEIATRRGIQRAHTLSSLIGNVITVIVVSLIGLLVLSELGFNLAPLLAGAGFLGVALGFGAQSLVADFVNGIFMLAEDQYGVGDIVDVGDASGVVEEVGLRVTQLRALDGSLWFVRNGEIMRVGNMSQHWSRTVLDINVAYGVDIKKARSVMTEVGEKFFEDMKESHTVLDEPEVWGVQELGTDSVVIRMVVKTSPGTHWSASRELRERIKNAFDEAGIEIPFPQRAIWLRNADAESAAAAEAESADDHGASESDDSSSAPDGDFSDSDSDETEGSVADGDFGDAEKS